MKPMTAFVVIVLVGWIFGMPQTPVECIAFVWIVADATMKARRSRSATCAECSGRGDYEEER